MLDNPLIFREDGHKYESLGDDSKKWTSVTTLIGKFKQPFDPDAAALKASKNKKSKWHGLTPDEIKEHWTNESKRATDLGTWYHNTVESQLCDLGTITIDGEKLPIYIPLSENDYKVAPIQKLEQGIYPEHFVYSEQYGICGQADRIDVIKDTVNIIDYKSNKEIKLAGFTSWDGVTQKMMPPVHHLDDCNFNHYSLQLSFYMYMILRANRHLKPGTLTIHHIIFEEEGKDKFGNPIHKLDDNGQPILKEVVPYSLPYLKTEVKKILEKLKENV